MSYAAAIDGLFSLAGELHAAPGQPRRKFELSEMRVLAEALGHPERAVSFGAGGGHKWQGIDLGDAGFDSDERWLPHGAVHVAAPFPGE